MKEMKEKGEINGEFLRMKVEGEGRNDEYRHGILGLMNLAGMDWLRIMTG